MLFLPHWYVGGAAPERRLPVEVTRVLQTPPCLEGEDISVPDILYTTFITVAIG